MNKLLSPKRASTGIVTILSLIVLFHFLVIGRIIPSDIVWGGNIPDENQIWMMEAISIAINLIMILFVLSYSGTLNIRLHPTAVKVGFWIMFAIFTLNTLGNLLAKSSLETYIFTPLTLLLALFCLRIAIDKNLKKEKS